MPAHRPYRAIFGLVAVSILCIGALAARAAEVWQTLPPMPSLPQSAISNYAEIDGARIWYAEWGKPSKTTPVLLLHGGFGNSNYFGNLIRFLVKHGYNVIAMDSLLQIGRSSSQKSFAIISFLRNTRWGW